MGLVEKIAPRGSRRRSWAARLKHRLCPGRPPTSVGAERRTLRASWAGGDPAALDTYLVSGFQNPQINAQSILTRHHLIGELFGDEHAQLMREELEHCVRATKALRRRARELGVRMGTSSDAARRARVLEVTAVIADWQDHYEKRWAEALRHRSAGPLRVLEFACGSANDYRYFDSYGLARFLDYTGVDLSEANVANARRRFPDVDFEVQDVLALPYENGSYDYVLAFDLFEHLSPAAIEQAVREARRLARVGLVVSFFHMADQPEHVVQPVRRYFWNLLSAPRMRDLLAVGFDSVEVIKIRDLFRTGFGYGYSYNRNAWTMIALSDRRHTTARV
ncbi:MAG: methyltransferase domain-containing protein [Streptosporangiales bacterium]|nr:methyltransferase domain-containing protein [Streptosporangiales bacterium]